MDKNRKLGLGVLGLLLVGTFGAHAAYARHGADSRDEEFWANVPPPTLPVLMPGDRLPDPVTAPKGPALPGNVLVKAEVDRTAVMQRGDGIVHVRVTLDTTGLAAAARVPTDFVVVFDRSG